MAFAPSSLFAQDVETLFLEGMSAFRGGDHDTALSRFREVVNQDPDRSDAIELMNASQDALVQLMMAGGEFETFALSVIEASRARDSRVIRDADAAAAGAAACLTGDYAARAKAIWSLSQTHGPFGAIELVASLGGESEAHYAAIYALSRMGSEATQVLLTATLSTDASVRLGACQALLELGDQRAMPRFMDMRDNDADSRIRALLADVQGNAADAYYDAGWAYFMNDPQAGLTEVENYGVLYSVDGNRVDAVDVNAAVLPLEIAKFQFNRAHELGHGGAAVGLAVSYCSQAATLRAAGDSAAANAQLRAALSLGPDTLDASLSGAIEHTDPIIALELVNLLNGPSALTSGGMAEALASDMPSVRAHAAIALASQGSASDAVVGELASAVGLAALRSVVIVDANEVRRATLAEELAAQGVDVTQSVDGTDGLISVHRGSTVDAFVIADPLPEFYARRLVKEIRRNRTYADSAILVLDSGETGDVDGAEVLSSISAGDVTGAFPELDTERNLYVAVATQAAQALAGLASHEAVAASAASDALAAACGRQDAISVPAMSALGHCGNSGAVSALLAVLGDDNRSSEARASAGNGLAGILSRTPALGEEGVAVLLAGMQGDDEAVARACASALGQMGGNHALTFTVSG